MSDELDNILSKSKKLLINREGLRNKVYKDSVGKRTVGVGHLLDITGDSNKDFQLFQQDYKKATGKDLSATSFEDIDLSEEDSMAIKRQDANSKLELLKSISGDKWDTFSDNQKSGLLGMAFQLGLNPSKYKNTAKMIREGRLEDLAKDINNWAWAKQTPNRAKDAQYLLTDFKYDSDIKYSDKVSHIKDLYDIKDPKPTQDQIDFLYPKFDFLPEQRDNLVEVKGTELDIEASRNYRSIDSVEPVIFEEDTITSMNDSQTNWGGKPRDFSSTFDDVKNLTLEGMGDDLVNKFVDRNAFGFLTQAAIETSIVNGKFDPNFNALEEKELYDEMTKDLDNDQLEDILKKTNNRSDFIKLASLEQGKNKRRKEMDEYTQKHPVLSGVNSVTNMLSEAAMFVPVANAIGAATAATEIKYLSQLSRQSMLSRHITGEILEQGVQELIWSKYDRDYEFDPVMFGAGIGLGVGLKQVFGSAEADRLLRQYLKNEDGFINLATNEGKHLVDEVAKNTSNQQAIDLAEAIVKRKVEAANGIRANLEKTRSAMVRNMTIIENSLKDNAGDIEKIKKLKSRKQNIIRKLKAFDDKLPTQLSQLADGTHPKLTAAVKPEFGIKHIAKELGIDVKQVNTVDKARKFLGLDKPDVDPDFVFEGEKAYQKVARKELAEMSDNRRMNMNETIRYAAGTDFVRSIDSVDIPVLGKLQLGDKLKSLADTDGPVSRLLFNKGNLVSSNNELVSSFYNWLAPDGMGRQGMSKIRAIESQQKYANIFGGDLLTIFHAHGDKLYEKLKGSSLGRKIKGFISPDDYEKTIEPLLKERLLDEGGKAFRAKYGNEVADIADNFYKDFNRLNKKIVERAKELGVEGVNFDATEGWFHRSWDFRKARAVDVNDLEDTVFRAMRSHMEKLEIVVDEKTVRSQAKKFAYGLRNADITTIEGMQSDHIKLLEKLMRKADDVETPVIKSEVDRLKMLKAKHDAGELANRVQMDINQTLSDGRKLADLLEDNVIHTQKRYTSRMAARIAAAEHGIKNIDDIEDWINDAVDLEVKRLAASGHKNPKEAVKHIKESMQQDFMSFKLGGMVGIHDLPDDSVSDFLRLAKKYNYARLMQYTGISSIAELGGTLVEAGVGNTLREMKDSLMSHLHDLYFDAPSQYTNRLYDELRSITGVGMEDFAFSSKGLSASTRITEEGIVNTFEKGIDSIGRVTQGTFGGIETVGRRITVNSLAIKWANHFTGNEKGGLLSAFFGSNGFSNRVLENSGFGIIDSAGKFIPNDTYNKIQESIKKFASFDDNGRLTKLNLEKWNTNVAHKFGDALQMQVNHIMVNPDATTMALWQSTTVGQILNQFRTFTVNATTKVFGQAVGNAVVSANRGDASEVIKGAQKIFWGTSLGMLSVALRQGIQRAGGDQEVDLFDEGAIKAAAIGFSRSSIAGNIPTLADTLSGAFGVDPIFEKTSSIGRSKNFFNLATTPTGQAVSGVAQGTGDLLQGEFSDGGMKLMKTSPLYRQIGVQQIFNFLESDK